MKDTELDILCLKKKFLKKFDQKITNQNQNKN